MKYPKRLVVGDTVGICAPSSPVDREKFIRGLEYIESLGLKIKLSQHIYSENGYLAGTDEERLADFHELIADKEVKGIIFARGGYGSGRFAAKIDYDLIRENPKIIWGFSDITFLHNAIYQKTNLITFHGPMITTTAREDFDAESKLSFEQLFTPTIRQYDERISRLEVISSGVASGQLIGGNLSLLVSTLGTEFEVDFTGKIVFIEDINEALYKIDGKLNQLKLANKWQVAAGIVVGDFHRVLINEEEVYQAGLAEERLQDLLVDYFKEMHIPVLSGFKIGHCFPHFAVAHGSIATLNTVHKTLVIEPGVC